MVMRLSDEDHDKVSAAITAAESGSNGEIVAIATAISDPYHDVALHWAVAALILVLAWAAWRPDWLEWWYHALTGGGGWGVTPTLGELLTFLMVLAVFKFTAALLILKWKPLRLALTPGATKHRRVRRRAIALFKAAAERRTVGRTGVLIYLSMAERRAEIVGDEAITSVTTPETWGEAMAVLLIEVRAGRPADGICAAIAKVGEVLTEHFPRTDGDTNEIPDKLIEL
jgi:putative membrane protein